MTINRLNQDVTYLPAFRNLIINGAMQVAQRGTSTASITTTGYYTADRWQVILSSLGTWTQSVENDAPTGSGFRKSTKMLCTTADAAPAASDRTFFIQPIEGQNLQAIRKGTSNAQQLTLSFWVKANVTGTYIVELFDNDNTRQVSASYSIASSATWEKKTIVFPADTTGAFDNDNAQSITLQFGLAAGTDFTSGTLNTSWASATNTNRYAGQTNLAAATNNYWQITGVQLEVGAVATPFEFKPIDVELEQCFRYFIRYSRSDTTNGIDPSNNYTITQAYTSGAVFGKIITLPVIMRANPTTTLSSVSHMRPHQSGGNFGGELTSITLDSTKESIRINSSSGGSGYVAGYASAIAFTVDFDLKVSAEL
jgi:hypothetical protein